MSEKATTTKVSCWSRSIYHDFPIFPTPVPGFCSIDVAYRRGLSRLSLWHW